MDLFLLNIILLNDTNFQYTCLSISLLCLGKDNRSDGVVHWNAVIRITIIQKHDTDATGVVCTSLCKSI